MPQFERAFGEVGFLCGRGQLASRLKSVEGGVGKARSSTPAAAQWWAAAITARGSLAWWLGSI